MSAISQLATILSEIDTPELRDICGEDEWIRIQRDIYRRVRRSLDDEIPLIVLIERAIDDIASHRRHNKV